MFGFEPPPHVARRRGKCQIKTGMSMISLVLGDTLLGSRPALELHHSPLRAHSIRSVSRLNFNFSPSKRNQLHKALSMNPLCLAGFCHLPGYCFLSLCAIYSTLEEWVSLLCKDFASLVIQPLACASPSGLKKSLITPGRLPVPVAHAVERMAAANYFTTPQRGKQGSLHLNPALARPTPIERHLNWACITGHPTIHAYKQARRRDLPFRQREKCMGRLHHGSAVRLSIELGRKRVRR